MTHMTRHIPALAVARAATPFFVTGPVWTVVVVGAWRWMKIDKQPQHQQIYYNLPFQHK
jgi:hypothetical protein